MATVSPTTCRSPTISFLLLSLLPIVLQTTPTIAAVASRSVLLTAPTIAAVASSSSDLEITLPVSPSTFWKMAHSEEFYRNTRVRSNAVSQKVLDMGKWMPRRGRRKVSSTELSSTETSAASNEATYFMKKGDPRGTEMLKREVILEYTLRSPFGTFDASNDQTLELAVEGETITYTEINRLSGFAGTSGDILGRTTWAATPGQDDPDSVKVRVDIDVKIMPLPFALGWLKTGVRKIMEKSMLDAAKGYMDAMAKEAEQPQSYDGGPLQFFDVFLL